RISAAACSSRRAYDLGHHEHQTLWRDRESQWRRQPENLAVDLHLDLVCTLDAHDQVAQGKAAHVLVGSESAERTSKGEPQQRSRSHRSHDDRRELSVLHFFCFGNADLLELQRIVSDHERRCAYHFFMAVLVLDLEDELTIALHQRDESCPQGHGPPPPELTRERIALLQQVRMQAEARVDQENAVVEHAHLDWAHSGPEQGQSRILHLRGNGVGATQVIECALWYHAER